MENIYEACSRCHNGKLEKYGFVRSLQTLFFSFLFILPFLLIIAIVIAIAVEKVSDPAIPATLVNSIARLKSQILASSAAMAKILSTVIISLLTSLAIFFEYKLPAHLKAMWDKSCPFCEQGYRVKRRISIWSTATYFFDIFLFEQILVPMYKALTFQAFWRKSEMKSRNLFIGLGKFVFYTALFFGSIPFLVFLLGQNKLLGLAFAVSVMVYVVYMIFSGDDEERDYQKGVVFLLIPLYYVSMVEIFRWAWVFSSDSLEIVPDNSNFLLMGLENLVRTQLFMDLFEVYDVGITTIESTSILSHSAIFATRLLLDIALISLLIQIAVGCFRRAWYYKHTGEKVTEVSDGETFLELESLAATGNPKDIHQVRDNLNKVLGVIRNIKPYVSSVIRIAKNDKEAEESAYECMRTISELAPAAAAEEHSQRTVYWFDRILAIIFVTFWAFALTYGIDIFIKDVTKREIAQLMALSKDPQIQKDPAKLRDIYLKVLTKDKKHDEALWNLAQTYQRMAALNLNLLDLDQALIRVDKSFKQLLTLEKLPVYPKYQDNAIDLAAQLYDIRGRVYFIQGDRQRALAELRKLKTQGTRRLLFNIQLIQACEALFAAETETVLNTAEADLGFDPEYQMRVSLPLLRAIREAQGQNWQSAIAKIQYALEKDLVKSAQLRPVLATFLGQALIRQGGSQFATAEQLLQKAFSENQFFAGISLANLYRLQNKPEQAQEIYGKLLQATKNLTLLNVVRLHKGLLLLTQQQNQDAVDEFSAVLQQHEIRDSCRDAISQFLLGKLSPEQLLEIAHSWDVSLAKAQRSLCNFYIACRAIGQKKYGEATEYLRRCVFLEQRKFPEYAQARRELENLQILLEGRSYQPQLLFDQNYFDHIIYHIRRDLLSEISPLAQTIESLAFIMDADNRYNDDKLRAITALTDKGEITPEQFFLALQKALDENDDKLKLAALEGLAKIEDSGYGALEAVVRELSSENERVRLAVVKVFGAWREKAIPQLQQALGDENKYVRRDAGYALAKLGKPAVRSLGALDKALYDEEVIVRDAAFAAVKSIGAPHTKEVLGKLVLTTKDIQLRAKALVELERVYPGEFARLKDKIIPLLVDILTTDKDEQSRRWAALNLLKLKVEDSHLDDDSKAELVKRIGEGLQDPDPTSRILAATWYLDAHERFAMDAAPATDIILARWELGDERDVANVSRLVTMPELLGKPTVKLLLQALGHRNPKVQKIGRAILDQLFGSDKFAIIAPDLIAQLADKLREMDSDEDEEAIEAVTELASTCINNDEATVIPLVLPLLLDENKQVRSNFLAALDPKNRSYTPTEAEMALLTKGLQAQPEVQNTVMECAFAFRLKSPELFSIYANLLDNTNPIVVAAAAKTMALFPERKDDFLPKIQSLLAKKVESDEESDDEEESDEDSEESDEDADEESDEDADEESDEEESEEDSDEDTDSDEDEESDEESDEDADEESDEEESEEDSDEDADSDEDEESDEDDEGDWDEEGDDYAPVYEAVLFTWGVCNGIETPYQMYQKHPHLEAAALEIIVDIQEFQKENIPAAKAIQELTKFFSSKDEEIVSLAIEYLGDNYGESKDISLAIPALLELKKSQSADIRKQAQTRLFEISSDHQLSSITPWLADGDESVRSAALKALGRLGSKAAKAVPQIISRLGDDSDDVRKQAIDTLHKVGKSAIKPLLKAVASKDPKVQIGAIYALGGIEEARIAATAKALVNKISLKNPPLALAALENLEPIVDRRYRKLLVPKLKETRRGPRPIQIGTWVLFHRIGYASQALPKLVQLLETSTDYNEQNYILSKLIELEPQYSLDYLKRALRQRYSKVNAVVAIKALETMQNKAKAALTILEEMGNDPNPQIRDTAKKATQTIKK